VEKLPDTIVNCTALKFVDICRTNIHYVPQFISSVKKFIDNPLVELIPQGHSLSYQCFCNSYYRMVETILRLSEKGKREGLLALEDDLDDLAEGFFYTCIRLIVDGTDKDILKSIMTIKIEREHDYYRKILMNVALEGVLCIQAGSPLYHIVFFLSSLVDIKDNLLDTACAKYLTGDVEVFSNIDFKVAIQPEEEREEVRFIKRAANLLEIAREKGKGLLALEKHLDRDAIAARDIFEYGLVFLIDDWNSECIEKVLSNLIEHETDPVQKNFAMAKKFAVMSIQNGDNPRILLEILCSYFDESITKGIWEQFGY
jgi:flagellar motor component MotA